MSEEEQEAAAIEEIAEEVAAEVQAAAEQE